MRQEITYNVVDNSDKFLVIQIPKELLGDLIVQLGQITSEAIECESHFLDLCIDNVEIVKEKSCHEPTKEAKAPDMNTGANDTHEAMTYQSEKLEKN